MSSYDIGGDLEEGVEPIPFDENGIYSKQMDPQEAKSFINEILDSEVIEEYVMSKTDKYDSLYITERIIFYPETGKVVTYQKRDATETNSQLPTVERIEKHIEASFNNWRYKISSNPSIGIFRISTIEKPLKMRLEDWRQETVSV